METLEALKLRTACNHFDDTHHMSQEEIKELVAYAQEVPTSFNMQNWRVIAFSSKEQKEKLKEAAYNQAKVATAAVCFLLVGITDGYKDVAKFNQSLAEKGLLPQAGVDGMAGMAQGMYDGNPVLQRDEAIRSASLSAMALMLAAQEKGYVSGPMIGFDPVAVSSLAELTASEVPVMLISVGRAAAGNWPRKQRRPISEQLKIV